MTHLSFSPRALAFAAFVVVIAAFPLAAQGLTANLYDFYLQQLSWVMIFGLFCMSLDLLVGIAGLVSLGHAAFFGLGAYFLILVTPEYSAPAIHVAVPLALAGVGLVALVVGALVLRTSGIYFIMVTLAFGQMFFYFFNDSKVAGGSDGIYLFVKPVLELGGITLVDLASNTQFYYTTLVVLVLAYGLLRMVLNAPFGKVIAGIGINEARTRALGYDVYFYKLTVFVIASVLAGLAGMLAASQYGFVNPSMLAWHMSGTALVTVILGGMGTLIGPLLAAFVIEALRHGLEALTAHWLLPFGLLIVMMVIVMPRGLAGISLKKLWWRRPGVKAETAAAEKEAAV